MRPMPALPLTMVRALPQDRARELGILLGLSFWLLYTRVYFALQAAHLAMPPCPFYYVTGHPCPFCGGTRSFAYMWRGDLADAVRLYPFGPALFASTVLGAGGLLGGALSGRTWTPRLSARQWYLLGMFVGFSLLFSWALKVFVLGN